MTGGELGGEQGVPEGQIAGVDRHDGGVGARAVAQHDRHTVTDTGVRGVGAVAPERDRVAVQGAQGPRDHADVEAAALPSGEDLGGEGVIGRRGSGRAWWTSARPPNALRVSRACRPARRPGGPARRW